MLLDAQVRWQLRAPTGTKDDCACFLRAQLEAMPPLPPPPGRGSGGGQAKGKAKQQSAGSSKGGNGVKGMVMKGGEGGAGDDEKKSDR